MKTGFHAFFTAVLCIAAGGLSSSGQNKTDILMDSTLRSHKIIFFGDGGKPDTDSITNLISRFYLDQFRHFQDPLAPYFLFMSRDTKLAMGIGGCVRMRGYYDWDGSIPSPGFAPYLIPMQSDPLRERYLGTTPAGTALFFRVIGQNKKLGDYQLYIEANFNGYNSRDFHLKKAYAVINDWTIGYANSTFSDPTALPPAVDASGPNAKMSATDVLIRWMHNFKHGWTVAASIETPSDQIDALERQTAKVYQYIPDFAAFGQWGWGNGNHFRIAGILRTLPYRDLLTQKNIMKIGWGLQFSSVVHATGNLTLYATFNGGRGYSSLGGDFLMGNYDLVNNLAEPGKMYAPRTFGGFGAVQYNFTPNIFASATFGGARYLPDHAVEPTEYKQGLYLAVNAFWYLTERISCGAEVDLGHRENFDRSSRWARRVNIMAQFSF